jgi:hypothetical protein
VATSESFTIVEAFAQFLWDCFLRATAERDRGDRLEDVFRRIVAGDKDDAGDGKAERPPLVT